jgi:hypothetical protein
VLNVLKMAPDRWKVVSAISAGGQGDVYRVTNATGELA